MFDISHQAYMQNTLMHHCEIDFDSVWPQRERKKSKLLHYNTMEIGSFNVSLSLCIFHVYQNKMCEKSYGVKIELHFFLLLTLIRSHSHMSYSPVASRFVFNRCSWSYCSHGIIRKPLQSRICYKWLCVFYASSDINAHPSIWNSPTVVLIEWHWGYIYCLYWSSVFHQSISSDLTFFFF